MTRELCKACWSVVTVGFAVPDGTWSRSVPERLARSVLCLGCFTRLADEAGVAWDEAIVFFPVSRETHRKEDE